MKSNTPWTATSFPHVWPISTMAHHQPWTEKRQEKNKRDSNHDRTPMQNPPACPERTDANPHPLHSLVDHSAFVSPGSRLAGKYVCR